MARKTEPELRAWSCGFCKPQGIGICHDTRHRCHEVWSGFRPATPGNPAGDVMCACALAGHPETAADTVVHVTDVELPETRQEVA